ncbi:OPT family oligopeptide transporter, partial [bacterium]|nr:OPT family oligopeptide transporter [bacterium]
KNMNVNLMSANITAACAGSSADLLTDLKSGYMLGAHPRKQFIAQFSGIFIGTVVTVFSFSILVPDASVLGTNQFPAPAAQTWKGVAEAMALGLHTLHPMKVWAIVVGGLVGIILPLLAKAFPKKAQFIPSAAGIGLAWTFHWFYGTTFLLGALIAWIWAKRNKDNAEEFIFPVASGVIAGGALMGVALIFWENGPAMMRQLFSGGK